MIWKDTEGTMHMVCFSSVLAFIRVAAMDDYTPPLLECQMTLFFPSSFSCSSPSLGFFLQGSSMSLSQSNSREHLGNGSDSDNWREHNGIGPTSPSDFISSIGSPKRKQNKSSNEFLRLLHFLPCSDSLLLVWIKF